MSVALLDPSVIGGVVLAALKWLQHKEGLIYPIEVLRGDETHIKDFGGLRNR